jgi:hypothetical protein
VEILEEEIHQELQAVEEMAVLEAVQLRVVLAVLEIPVIMEPLEQLMRDPLEFLVLEILEE